LSIALAFAVAAALTQPSERRVFLDGGFGYLRTVGDDDGWIALEGVAYRAFGPFAAGATLGTTSRIFGEQRYHVAITAGAHWFPAERLRVALLGEFGAHHYVNIGSGIFSSGGPSASRGFAGARLSLAGHIGPRFSIGGAVIYRNDLSRAREGRHVVGEASLGGLIEFGAAW
jgi:hypothetical protein